MSKKSIMLVFVAALSCALCLAFAACSPKADPTPTPDPAPVDPAPAPAPAPVAYDKDDPYVSDEVCMSCHGGSYEAIAKLTESYGDQNPHNAIHGAPNSCDNCHDKGGEVSHNMCDNCHAWPRPAESIGLMKIA